MRCQLAIDFDIWGKEWEGICLTCYDGAPYDEEGTYSTMGWWRDQEKHLVVEMFEAHKKGETFVL